MLHLPNVTLIAIATQNVEAAREAIFHSDKEIQFGRYKLLSPYCPRGYDKNHWQYIPEFTSIDDWNYFIVYELYKYIDTDFCLLIHEDGFVVNPQSWRDEFLNYDYIGSPWSMEVAKAIQGGRDQELVRVGNSVSIRSKKLLELPSKINMPWVQYNGDFNEDTQLTAHNRALLQSHGITYAPIDLAAHFGREHVMPENEHITSPFVFHKHHHPDHPNWNYPKF